jgi:hypothetical protein
MLRRKAPVTVEIPVRPLDKPAIIHIIKYELNVLNE